VTIGIGVLCSTQPSPYSPRPDAIVFLGDATGSEETDSAHDKRRIHIHPEEKLFYVSVGRVEKSVDFLATIRKEFRKLKSKNDLTVTEALNRSAYEHRARHFHFDVFSDYYVPYDDNPYDRRQHMLEAWQRYDVGVQALVATFDKEGQALMYMIARLEGLEGVVHRILFPGSAVIGYGVYEASFWINIRQQAWGCSTIQSAYHAYEANCFAAGTPLVRENLEIMLATTRSIFHLSEERPKLKGCPVSFDGLEAMFNRYGPHSTDDLGFSRGLPKKPPKRKRAAD
jgi:hypothetical protein